MESTGSPQSNEVSQQQQRPNVLFVLGEDWGRFASAYSGVCELSNLIRTPHFDSVASGGVLFLNAFTDAPGCNPARSAIMAGRHFFQTGLGAIEQGTAWDGSVPTFPLLLEQDGYFLGHSYEGKHGKTSARIGAAQTKFQGAGDRFEQISKVLSEAPSPEAKAAAKEALLEEVRQNFASFLAAAAKEASNKPFVYVWGPTTTHRNAGWPSGSGEKLWGLDPRGLQGKMPPYFPDVDAVRRDLSDYLGQCVAMDSGLGALLQELKRAGAEHNTIVVCTGDHGPPGFPRCKATLYEMGTRVPLAIRWPACFPAGRVVSELVSTRDLAPTLCAAARVGGSLPAPRAWGMTGRSLLPLLLPFSLSSSSSAGKGEEAEFVVSGLERHVCISRAGFLPFPQRRIRTNRFLLIRNFEPQRWPAGDPCGLLESPSPSSSPSTVSGRSSLGVAEAASALSALAQRSESEVEIVADARMTPEAVRALATSTMLALPDTDASPTKAWMLLHRQDHRVAPLVRLAFGKRPALELYDLVQDPHCLRNLAKTESHAETRQRLLDKLTAYLGAQGDPRVLDGKACRFEAPPYAGALVAKYQGEKGRRYLGALQAQRKQGWGWRVEGSVIRSSL